jgi:hypothetical protein
MGSDARQVEFIYATEGRCMGCHLGVSVYHYTEYGVKREWRNGCRCSDRNTPSNGVQEELYRQRYLRQNRLL